MSALKEIREKVLTTIGEVAGENKEMIIEAYERVMKLEHIARREGLLALEYEAEFMPKETHLCDQLTEMIELVVGGTDPQIIEELMTLKFFSRYRYDGIEALLYFLYARSLLMIQAGESPWLIEEFFNAVMPQEVTTFKQRRIMLEERQKQKIEKWKSGLTAEEKEGLLRMSVLLNGLSKEEWKIIVSSQGFYGFDQILPYLEEETKVMAKNFMNTYRYYTIMRRPRMVARQELEELEKELEKVIFRMCKKEKRESILDEIQKYSDEEIQLLLRHIDNLTLTVALKGAGVETQECFYRNLSERLRNMIQEDGEYMGAVRMGEVEAAEEKILETARKVLNRKEV